LQKRLRKYYSIDGISPVGNTVVMAWEVEASDEFKEWYENLDEAEQASVAESVDMLEDMDLRWVDRTQTHSVNRAIQT
jgi:hypothetical protein